MTDYLDEAEGPLPPGVKAAFIVVSVLLVLVAGLMSGLTLGLMSLDTVELEVLKRSGARGGGVGGGGADGARRGQGGAAKGAHGRAAGAWGADRVPPRTPPRRPRARRRSEAGPPLACAPPAPAPTRPPAPSIQTARRRHAGGAAPRGAHHARHRQPAPAAGHAAAVQRAVHGGAAHLPGPAAAPRRGHHHLRHRGAHLWRDHTPGAVLPVRACSPRAPARRATRRGLEEGGSARCLAFVCRPKPCAALPSRAPRPRDAASSPAPPLPASVPPHTPAPPPQTLPPARSYGLAIGAHMAWLDARGFRLLPPGAVPRPKSEDEAMAMLKASKDWFDAKKRKGGLVGGVAPRKLILPPGTH